MIKCKKLEAVIDRAIKAPAHKEQLEEMNRFMKMYTGEYWKEKFKKRDAEEADETEITCNFAFSTIATIAPLLTDNKPKWGIRSKFPQFQSLMEIYKSAADCLWESLDMDMKIYDLVVSGLAMKMGYFKVVYDPDALPPLGEVDVKLVDPRHFVLAPGYTDLWDPNLPWCGEIMQKPLSYIRQKYPRRGYKVKADTPEKEIQYELADTYELTDQYATIYNIWVKDADVLKYTDFEIDGVRYKVDKDRKDQFSVKNSDMNGSVDGEQDEKEPGEHLENKKKEKKDDVNKIPKGYKGPAIIVWAKGHSRPLEYRSYPYHHGKPPYVPYYDYKIPFRHTGQGEIDQLETMNMEFNLLLRKMAQHLRDYMDPDWVVFQGSGITDTQFKENRRKGGNVWYPYAEKQPPQFLPSPPINRDASDFIGSLPKLMEEESGVTDTTKGMAAKKQRQSAHEINALLETSYTRTRQRVRNLEWTIKRTFFLIVELMQQFYTEVRTYSGTQQNGEYYWVNIANSAEFIKKAYSPSPKDPSAENKKEEEQKYQEQLKKYNEIAGIIGNEKSLHIPFEITVETNSTLPLDKQSLANLCMKLAELQLTPQAGIDLETLLETLNFPQKDKVLKRMKELQQQQQAQQQQGGM